MSPPCLIGTRAREARRRAGLSQAQLAEQAGVTNETISRLERGAFEPSLPTLIAVADVLDVSLDWLVGRTPASQERPRRARGLEELITRVERLDPKARRVLLSLSELLLKDERRRR